MKYIVVAYDKTHAIGLNGRLPWQGNMPADMKHFKNLTVGSAVIMGRKTYDSIGRPLPNRLNIVLTKQNIEIEGVTVVHSLKQAYKEASGYKEMCIVGGAQIFNQAFDTIDKIYATEIDTNVSGDTFFSFIDPTKWKTISKVDYSSDNKNLYNYSFVEYERIRASV